MAQLLRLLLGNSKEGNAAQQQLLPALWRDTAGKGIQT
jgi:hypothetical protein